jgi:pimeloyl-ACP methyl ester carboxylesterase
MSSPNPLSGEGATTRPADDLRGVGRLAIDAVTGVTDLVEAMHRTISGIAPPLGKAVPGPTGGIAGLVYRSVRGATRLVGQGIDAALTAASPLLREAQPMPLRDAAVAALNGVYGDHLERSGNPLAIPMTLRRDGVALKLETTTLRQLADLGPHPLIALHGLCMNDRQWRRNGHDHAAALATEFGYTPLYLHYNSGRHVADNGRDLAELIEQLLVSWPLPIESLTLLGHSMGGLLARSAMQHARERRLAWAGKVRAMVFLGTPHHGAPLERAGNWFDTLLSQSPYSAPFLRLGESRSAGIKDLRFGHITDAVPRGRHRHDTREPVPLPAGVRCYAVAATRGRADRQVARLPSDGLVPIASALGTHHDPAHSLAIPGQQQWIAHECSHFDLLSRADVYARLHEWLALPR